MADRWKAIRLKRRDAAVEIYDLENDPGEEKDLAAERADMVKRAKELFESERTESEDWPMKDAPNEPSAKR